MRSDAGRSSCRGGGRGSGVASRAAGSAAHQVAVGGGGGAARLVLDQRPLAKVGAFAELGHLLPAPRMSEAAGAREAMWAGHAICCASAHSSHRGGSACSWATSRQRVHQSGSTQLSGQLEARSPLLHAAACAPLLRCHPASPSLPRRSALPGPQQEPTSLCAARLLHPATAAQFSGKPPVNHQHPRARRVLAGGAASPPRPLPAPPLPIFTPTLPSIVRTTVPSLMT